MKIENLEWASCNLGASAPEDAGYYFQWGDATPHTPEDSKSYDWNSYKYCEIKDDKVHLTKYCYYTNYGKSDNLMSVQIEDDPIKTILGDGWRLPTRDDCSYLIWLCDKEWVENWNNTGINGVLYNFSKTGEEMFIPAAGYLYDNELCKFNKQCWNWSDTLFYDMLSYCLVFNEMTYYTELGPRYIGVPIRPVRDIK